MPVERDSDHSRQTTDREQSGDANTQDEWGDLDVWTHINGRRNLVALGADEELPWEPAPLPSSDELPGPVEPSQGALPRAPTRTARSWQVQ